MFRTADMKASGNLLNVGKGGILFRSPFTLSLGEKVTVSITVAGDPMVCTAQGTVVHTQLGTYAIRFLDKPTGQTNLLRWVEQM